MFPYPFTYQSRSLSHWLVTIFVIYGRASSSSINREEMDSKKNKLKLSPPLQLNKPTQLLLPAAAGEEVEGSPTFN